MNGINIEPKFKRGYCIALHDEAHRTEKIRQDAYEWCGMEVEDMLVERPNIDFSNMHFPIDWKTKLFGINYYIGCGDSHRLCWEKIASNEPGWYLVFESDCKVDFKNAATFRSAENLLDNFVPDDADILALGSLFHLNVNSKWDMFKHSRLAWFTHEVFQAPITIPHSRIINEHVRIPSIFAGGQGYALTPKGAQKLLDRIGTIRFHCDYEISAAVANDPSIRLYSTRVNVLRQKAQIEGKRPTYPMLLNKLCDEMMCFDMSVSWNLTLPLWSFMGVSITAWSVFIALSPYLGLLLGFDWEHLFYGWLSANIFWAIMSFPYNGDWKPLCQTLVLSMIAWLPIVFPFFILMTVLFVANSRIHPPNKPTKSDFTNDVIYRYNSSSNVSKFIMIDEITEELSSEESVGALNEEELMQRTSN